VLIVHNITEFFKVWVIDVNKIYIARKVGLSLMEPEGLLPWALPEPDESNQHLAILYTRDPLQCNLIGSVLHDMYQFSYDDLLIENCYN
jgi:hypothetical protein